MGKKYQFQEVFTVPELNGNGILDEDRDDALESLDESIDHLKGVGEIVSEMAASCHLFYCECLGLRRRNDELEIDSICYRMARIIHSA